MEHVRYRDVYIYGRLTWIIWVGPKQSLKSFKRRQKMMAEEFREA